MSERPIIFTGDEVRAIIEGRKTQTRRPIKRGDVFRFLEGGDYNASERRAINAEPFDWDQANESHPTMDQLLAIHPSGSVGDRLWVRETWRVHGDCGRDKSETSTCTGTNDCEYAADFDGIERDMREWRPSIHMPRWASRITLAVKRVRVQRVQEISEADAVAEGFGGAHRNGTLAILEMCRVWDEHHGTGAWARNDWVWAIEFEGVK